MLEVDKQCGIRNYYNKIKDFSRILSKSAILKFC